MRYTFLLTLLLAAVPASAQTVESKIDLSSLGMGRIDMPEPIETDGDFTTREWLIRSLETNQFRVVVERDGQACAGEWFDPRPHPFASVAVRRVGVVHKLLVRFSLSGSDAVTVVALDTPVCR